MVLGVSYNIKIKDEDIKEIFIDEMCVRYSELKEGFVYDFPSIFQEGDITIFRSKYPNFVYRERPWHDEVEFSENVKIEEFPDDLFFIMRSKLEKDQLIKDDIDRVKNLLKIKIIEKKEPPKDKEDIENYNRLIFESFSLSDSQKDVDKKMEDMKRFITKKNSEYIDKKDEKKYWSHVKHIKENPKFYLVTDD
jgi:hypothetical protein